MDNHLPVLDGDEARQIDLDVTERLGRVRVLESVAVRIADTIRYHLPSSQQEPLLFVAGKGNNGANAIAAARILKLRGFAKVKLVTLLDVLDKNEEKQLLLRPNIKEQVDIFVDFFDEEDIFSGSIDYIRSFQSGVLVDGVLGTGIKKPPTGIAQEAIDAMNETKKNNPNTRILSIDMPSGLNHVTGCAPGACVHATWTLSLHMLKRGQLQDQARPFIGELWMAESSLGFVTFPKHQKQFEEFYANGPIRKVFCEETR